MDNEMRLVSSINDNMVHINNYDLIRKDRSRNGGGICIFFNSINYKIKHDLIPQELECACIEIIKLHSRLFLVSKVYRQTDGRTDGRTDGWAGGRADGRTDGPFY